MNDDVAGWAWFLRIVERGSISAAARDLNQTVAALSVALKRLETQLGVRLLQRSTRRLALTPDGEIWYRHARTAQEAIDAGLDELANARGEIAGPLRVSAPSDFGRQFVVDWLEEFCRRHPRIVPTLALSDRVDDLIAESLDIAIRYGTPPDSDMVATPLAPNNRRVVVAHPDYWARHGQPRHPADLANHSCLAYSLRETPHVIWRFASGDGTELVSIKPTRQANDGAIVSEWARRGLGVAYKSQLDVARDLAAGRLVAALPDWQGEPTPLYLVRSGGRQVPPRVQAFKEFCLTQMG